MQTAVKVLETVYQGTRFRSRTEARWAVFFDALGLRWLYEPEGYDLGDGIWYLPDFLVPDLGLLIEVKPALPARGAWPDDKPFNKMCRLGQQLSADMRIVMLCGPPGYVHPDLYGNAQPYEGFIMGDNSQYWCECRGCGALGVQFDGRAGRNKHATHCAKEYSTDDKGYNVDSPRLLTAYKAACSARF